MDKHIRKLILLTIMVLPMILHFREAKASHAMGADLTYECLGGNTYRIKVSFYRDCIGIAAPNSVYVSVQSISCGQNIGVTCQPVSGTGLEVTPLCASAISSCNGGVYTGIQEWVYQGIITLPMQCPDWVFSYNLCCRNAAITNITAPSSSTFYIYATLNNTISPCNSSPTFSNKPVPFACIGQQYCFNHGAFDPDGDSLVYSLITPLQSATSTVNYTGGFNASNPLTSAPPITFNTATGDICMTPSNMEITVMAVLVKEYRNGILIGSVERDIQVTVLNCNNTLPTLTGINGTNNFSSTVCAGEQLCFTINSADGDASQNVAMTWDGSIAGATFTTSGGTRPTGTFCWTPSTSDISNNQYCFTVRVNDNACPMNGAQIYSYCITVVGFAANAGPDQMIACNAQANLSVTTTGGTGPFTYLWSNGSTSPTQSVGIGTYIVTVNDGTCTDQDTIEVINAFVPAADFAALGTCPNSPVQFTDQSTLPGGSITSWIWNFGGTGSSNVQNPSHAFPGPGSYNVSLVITTNLGCKDTIIQPVVISQAPNANFASGPGCAGASISFNNTTTPSGTFSWQWNFGNGQNSVAQNPSVSYANSGSYTVTLVATDSIGCADTITQQIAIYPVPVAAFSNSTLLCQGGSITFNNSSTAGGGTITGYSWNFGNGQTSTVQNPSVTYAAGGNYNVSLTVTNSLGCSSTVIHNIGVNTRPVISIGPNQAICIGGSTTLTATGGVSYIWTPYGQTTNPITVNPSTNTTYGVVGTDANGCTSTASVNVTVNQLPVVNVSPSQSICAGQSATLSAIGATNYSWSPSGNSTATINVTPATSTTYAVTGTNANGCSSTAFVTVTVNPRPVVNVSNVFVCAGSTSTMSAGNPGATYQWSSGQTTSTIVVSNPGTYTVTVTNAFGCSATGSAIASLSGTIVNTLQNSSFCNGGSTVLNAGNPGNNYLWSTGATTQTITVNNGGAYSVTITDPNGCSGTLSTTVNVNPLPVANFTPNDICINQSLQFNDISSIASGNIVSWSWNFGDGNVSQLQDPSHNYASSGSYVVTLVVTSNSGCTDSITRLFNVFPLPQANFSYNFACANEPILFTDMSFTNMGNITGWSWDFGDGGTASVQNPSHGFPSAGTYNVALTVTTAGGCTDTRIRNIQIYPLPDLSFITNPSAACQGSSMTITNTSSSSNGAITSWFWDFGDGSTSTIANPSHLYTNPGSHSITLIGVTSHGCADTMIQQFVVNPTPVADGGVNQNVCLGSPVTLTASGGVSYVWSTGSTQQTIQPIPVTFLTTYYVTVTDANGCTDMDSVKVYTRTYPNVNAGPNKSICLGQSVTLTGNWTNNHNWQPTGDTTQSITVSPTTTTNYIYTYANTYGCAKRDTVTVTVNPLPLANAGPDLMVCNGSTATITATGGTSYLWTPTGATTASIYVAPTTPQVYSVLVTNSYGCTARDTVSVGINPVPFAVLSPAFLCIGSSATLNAGNPGSTYLWQPNGETTQTITVSDSGYYQVLITNAVGCVGVAGVDLSLGGTGITSNPVNVNICDGQSTTLNANNPGATYLWSNGATSQTINVTTQGVYSVTITDATGCSASFASNVVVNPVPQMQFISTPTCAGESTLFTNLSTISSGNIIAWDWSFGDGTISNDLQPTHQYSASGTYPVTLQATSGMGCTASQTQSLIVEPKPAADFTASIVCLGQQTMFQDISTVSSSSITSWSWDFGDGSASTMQHPVHTYASPGIYTVTMAAFTNNGCSDTVTTLVQVLDAPVATFSVQNVCAGSSMAFLDGSTLNNGFITGYQWSFGDGNSSTLQNPVYTYQASGTYNATLSVTSDVGCSATFTQPVIVYPMPVAQATAPPVCDGIPAQFTSTSTITSGSIATTYWNFGDGGSSNDIAPGHVFTTDGTYNILLTVTSDQGCVDSLNMQAIVHPMPESMFNVTDACFGQQVQFTDQSTISSGTINNWLWNMGDGNITSQQNPLYTYNSPGSYAVLLQVTSNFGCIDSMTSNINIYSVPVAAFAGSNVCAGQVSEFFNQSTISGGGQLSCNWNFGDGTTSNLIDPQHTYSGPGIYTVTLVSTSQFGCSDTVTKQFTIYTPPVAAFTAINACDAAPVNFTDLSSSIDGVISTWSWNLGDGTLSNSANPHHTYGSYGNYNVSLTVTSVYGCVNTITDTVSVFSLPVPVISVNSNCEYDPVTFNSITAAGDTSTYQYAWLFGDGSTSNISDPSHLYSLAGNYNITLTMTNINGCVAVASSSVVIYPAPDADFQATNACAESSVTFTNQTTISSGTIAGYIWNFGDNTSGSTQVNPVHTYNSPGVYTVTLIAISDNGCMDTTSQQVTVFPLPVPGFSYSQAAGCGPLSVSFTDSSFISSGNIIAWSWDFGNGATSGSQNPTIIYNHSGTYGVTLTVTSNMGCMQTFTQPNIITVFPGPTANFIPDPYQASILEPVFDFNNVSTGGSVYTWTFGDGGSSSMFEPSHIYQDTGVYVVYLQVQNAYGCIDTVSHIVHVIPEFTLYVPNAFTPNKDGVNDVFTVFGLGIEEVVISIFNRWGENIYTTQNIEAGWDGTVQKTSQNAQQDVYIYNLTVKDVFDRSHIKSGTVTLVR